MSLAEIQQRRSSFNTSHVTLYQLMLWGLQQWKWVSIHLMLLFIKSGRIYLLMWGGCFNTSHVTLYLEWGHDWNYRANCFNTSHVTLYRSRGWKFLERQMSFNTSHVTLYQYFLALVFMFLCVSIHLMLLFIPFSSISTIKRKCVSIHLMLLFIRKGGRYMYNDKSFNTSHVTLYLTDEERDLIVKECFNTSHVTLYRHSAGASR